AGPGGGSHLLLLACAGAEEDVVPGYAAAAGVAGRGPGEHGAGGGDVPDRGGAGCARRGHVLAGFFAASRSFSAAGLFPFLGGGAPHRYTVVVEHDVRGGGEFVADALEGPVVGGVPSGAAGDAELDFAAVLRLAAGEDLLPGAVDLHVVQVAGDVVDVLRGGALVVGGAHRDVRGVHAFIEGEPVPEGALVQHPGRPARL